MRNWFSTESKGPGQPGQWIRICASCKWIFLYENRSCPNCGFAHYGAPMIYESWLKSIYAFFKQWISKIFTGKWNNEI